MHTRIVASGRTRWPFGGNAQYFGSVGCLSGPLLIHEISVRRRQDTKDFRSLSVPPFPWPLCFCGVSVCGLGVAFDWCGRVWACVGTVCLCWVFFGGCGWVRVGWVRVGWVCVDWVCGCAWAGRVVQLCVWTGCAWTGRARALFFWLGGLGVCVWWCCVCAGCARARLGWVRVGCLRVFLQVFFFVCCFYFIVHLFRCNFFSDSDRFLFFWTWKFQFFYNVSPIFSSGISTSIFHTKKLQSKTRVFVILIFFFFYFLFFFLIFRFRDEVQCRFFFCWGQTHPV